MIIHTDVHSDETETSGPVPTPRDRRIPALLLTASGVAISALAFRQSSISEIGSLGLIEAIPVWFFAGPALIICGLYADLDFPRRAWIHLTSLVVVVHGLPGFVEPTPRFPVAWLHVGFSDHIATTGELLPQLDARFSWPGFFAASGFLERVVGTESLFWILRFAPVGLNLAAIAAVYGLARSLGSSERRAVVACSIFALCNWIGQDYFAPQAVSFVTTTLLIAVVLRFFSARASIQHWSSRFFGRPDHRALGGAALLSPRQLALVYIGFVVVSIGMVMSHQLAPPMLIVSLFGLWFVRRTQTPNLAFIVLLAFTGWLSFAAEAYWLGHFNTLVADVGDVSSLLTSNVSERSAEGSAGRALVVRARLLLMAAIWVAGAASMLWQRRSRQLDPAIPALFLAPFIPLVLQPYGGEMLLRVALFTLPTVSITLAQAIESTPRRERAMIVGSGFDTELTSGPTSIRRSAMYVVALTLVVPLFVLARFGNESYERVSVDDEAVAEYLYKTAGDTTMVFTRNRQALINIDRLDDVSFRLLPADTAAGLAEMRNASAAGFEVYAMLGEGQEILGIEVNGREVGWIGRYAEEIADAEATELIMQSGESYLLRVEALG